MPQRVLVFYSLLTPSLLLIPAVALYSELGRRSDIWWTPAAMAVSLPDSRDRVEIYVRDQPLAILLEHKQVSVADGAMSRVLSAQEIRLRFNNWDRVRAGRLPLLLIYAAACGAAVVLLVLIATGRLAYRGEREAVAV